MSNQKEAILAEMGIKPLWRLRADAVEAAPEKTNEVMLAQRPAPAVVFEEVSSLIESAQSSSGVHAEEVRPERLLGEVLSRADWLFVADGDAPLSPQAARLLDGMLAAIQLKRSENVWVADAGQVLSAEQFEQIKPRLVVALGQVAAQRLLGGERALDACRGRLFSYQDVPLIVSEHPEDLLSHPERKARVWEDLCLAQDQLA